ncbi:MAG: hypothetical protein JWN86_2163 [Planctomycetota bacterium]|nr:hypothetical protein [Planctomycetota bacterium]
MARSRYFLAVAALALGASGCAHCDTCDKMPVPCSGLGCSAALVTVPSPLMGPPASGPFSNVPPSGAISSPGLDPARPTALSLVPPPLPLVPTDPPSPPPGPAAPEKP